MMTRQQWATFLSKIYFSTDEEFLDLLSSDLTYLNSLQKLKHLSSIQIQILALLILQLEVHSKWCVEPLDFISISEFLKTSLISDEDLKSALDNLIDQNYINPITFFSPIIHDITQGYLANKKQLVQKELYVPKWDLNYLGLHNICFN